jgi:hypothetical protein
MKWSLIFFMVVGGIFYSTRLPGQFYSTGEAPASVKWNKISTPNFNIIYPVGLAGDAINFANKLEYYLPVGMGDLKHPMNRKLSVLLHSTSVLSNGYVALAPRRMEVVLTPPQDSYAQDWITQLTLHEFRHVAQLNLLRQGFTASMGVFTGEIANGVVSSQIPSWFYEGDAVYNETQYSATGRGRIPGFVMPLRTLLIDRQELYTYDKLVFGSYRNFVPDQYSLGYQMVNYARSKYGDEFWAGALNYTARHPFYIWPLAFYLKKNTGFYKTGLYEQTMDSLKSKYINEKEVDTYSEYSCINKRDKSVYTSYLIPKDMGHGKILAMRTGLADPGSCVIIDSMGAVKKLFITGRSMNLKSDIFHDRLIWDEVVSDPRWERRDYSEIRWADLRNGKKGSLTKKTRYFSPDFSPDGRQIAVVETDNKNRNFITILDALTGKFIRQVPSAENRAIQFPDWISNTEIIVITVSEKGKQLEILNLNDENWTVIMPYTWFDIAEPCNYKNFILFRSSYHELENIFAVSKTNSAIIYQLTFSHFGAYHPAVTVDSLNLLFSNYGPNGFDIVSLPLDSSSWKRISPPSAPKSGWEHINNLQNSISYERDPVDSYAAEPYRKWGHLFNIHSWTPFYTNVEDIADNLTEIPVYLGGKIYSQNLLSTVNSSIGYRYNHGFHEFIPSIRWSGWYPVIELTGQLGGPQRTLQLPDGIELAHNAAPYHEISLKTYIPLLYNRGKYVTQVQPMVEYQRSGTWYYYQGDLMKDIDFIHLQFSVFHYLRLAQRDLYPRWGQLFSATYTLSPVDKGQFGDMFSVQAVTFFPGLTHHHHFFIRGGMQVQHPEAYFIPINRVNYPRGYNSSVSKEFTSIMLNYSFPAGYPDLSIGPLLYLKRFRVNLFYDWSYGAGIREITVFGGVDYTGIYRSFGTEILADMHLIRFIFPFSAGVRMGYIPGKGQFFTEMLLSLDTGIF